jgi:hypothetical protein
MKSSIFVYMLAIVLPLAACTLEPDTSNLPPGKYERVSRSTDAQGTERVNRSYVDIEEDEQGHRKTTTESETTKDPKGLFNKQTVKKSKKTTTDPAKE